MNATLTSLVDRLGDKTLIRAGVIPWSCPIPAFGDPNLSSVATLGLNPSNREFVDECGDELDGQARRFHTLKSLGLSRWADAGQDHLCLIAEACKSYFAGNPYDAWFRRLDYLLSGTEASYYGFFSGACHLDLIPYATAKKWADLTSTQRGTLLEISGDALGLLLRESTVRLLVLNGRSVVENFENIAAVQLNQQPMTDWSLPRRIGPGIAGTAYSGTVCSLAGIDLGRHVTVLGFNHNIQSSFGVTRVVTDAIRRWLTKVYARV